MKHLSGMDATFFHVETPETPMHVGSLCVVSLPEGYAGDYYEDYKAQIGSRLHLAEVFERKLALMPFELSNPIWVDDDDVDLDYHVRRIILSKPGTFQQLEQYVARLHSSLMDRSRPLWELYVIEGLQSGQMAIYSKVHHAAVDGQAGVALAKALYDISPEPRQIKPRREKRRSDQYQLGAAELVVAGMRNTAEQYMKLVTTLPNTWQALTSISLPKVDEALPKIGPNTDWGTRAAHAAQRLDHQSARLCGALGVARRREADGEAAERDLERRGARGLRPGAAPLSRRRQRAAQGAVARGGTGQPARGRQHRAEQSGHHHAGEPRDRHRRSARAAEGHQSVRAGRRRRSPAA